MFISADLIELDIKYLWLIVELVFGVIFLFVELEKSLPVIFGHDAVRWLFRFRLERYLWICWFHLSLLLALTIGISLDQADNVNKVWMVGVNVAELDLYDVFYHVLSLFQWLC